ncbi:MAG TPA: fructose 1,6-bisphosphatase [Methanocorpusculum sp.]|nr:fructose 1,6-bisphosphatase [Methanocorpusculum sp.]
MTVVSVFAKTVGGIAGKARIYPDILQAAAKSLRAAEGDVISDSFATHAGDRLILLMVHKKGADVSSLRDSIFDAAQKQADGLGLFNNQTPDSAVSLEFSGGSQQFLLFVTGSDDAGFWNKIMTSEAGTAADTGIFLAKSEGEYPTTARRCEAFAKSSFLGVCPVSLCETGIMREYVTPVAGLGFSLFKGKLIGPVDLFDSALFDAARLTASHT